MVISSDMMGFPEAGYPVLKDPIGRVCFNTLYTSPLIQNGFIVDIEGALRARTITTLGVITGVGIAAGGAISGATTIAASGTVTLSSATAPLTLSGATSVLLMSGQNASFVMSGLGGRVGTPLQRIPYGFFKTLDISEKPTVDGVPLVSMGDLMSNYVPYTGATKAINIGANDLDTTGDITANEITTTGKIVQNNTSDASIIMNRTTHKACALGAGTSGGIFQFDESGYWGIQSEDKATILSGVLTGDMRLYINGTTGYIGLGGNITPSEVLDVTGSIKTSTSIKIGSSPAYAEPRKLYVYDDGVQYAARVSIIGTNDTSYPALEFVTGGNTQKRTLIRHDGEGGGDYALTFWTTKGEVVLEKLRLTGGGNLKQVGDNYGHYFGAADDASILYDGTNLIINSRVVGSGFTHFPSTSSAGVNRVMKIGTGTTTNNDGNYIEFPTSTIDGYGIRVGGLRNEEGSGKGDFYVQTGANSQETRFVIRDDGNIRIPADSKKLLFGAGFDASITYDGTNMLINPKEVGSGILDVAGVLQTDGYNSSDGTAGLTATKVFNDGAVVNTVTIKDGLITSWVQA